MEYSTHSTSLFSRLFYCWAFPLIRKGNRKELEIEDIPPLPPFTKSKRVLAPLEREWNYEIEKSKSRIPYSPPNLKSVLVRVYGFKIFRLGLLIFFKDNLISCAIAVLLGYNLDYLEGNYSDKLGMIFVGSIIFLLALKTILAQPYLFLTNQIAMDMRVACSALVYQKILKLSPNSIEESNVGQVSNILSNDLYKFDFGIQNINYLWATPTSLVVSLLVLYYYVGVSAAVGIGIFFGLIPFQYVIGKMNGLVRAKLAARTDVRAKLINEIINGMLLIKIGGWELLFTKDVQKAREHEEVMINLRAYVVSVIFATVGCVSQVTIFATLLFFLNLGNTFTPINVFVTMTILTDLGSIATGKFNAAVVTYTDISVALNRLEKFLLKEEKSERQVEMTFTQKPKSLIMKRYCGKVGTGDKTFKLSDISLRVDEGKFICVIGQVGSGKSTIIKSILGEIRKTDGVIEVNGRIAFVPQEAWIFPGTVQENILFGKPMVPTWYSKVIEACALTRDLNLFKFGDQSLIGERGVTLSGGQKTRVSLARAVYNNADIYLLDDPLSGVDTKVCKHLIEHCFRGILSSKAVFLITHQSQYLQDADEIILLEQGTIKDRGTYKELDAKNLIHASSNDVVDDIDEVLVGSSPEIGEEKEKKETAIEVSKIKGTTFESKIEFSYGTFSKMKREKEVKEDKSEGALGLYIVYKFLMDGNGLIKTCLLFLASILSQTITSASNYILKLWTSAEEDSLDLINSGTLNESGIDKVEINLQAELNEYKFIYILLNSSLIISFLLSTITVFKYSANSSILYHLGLLKSIMRAPMRFFETNTSGRVINRFVKDMGTLDQMLAFSLYQALTYVMKIFGILAIVSILNPIFLAPAALLLVVFYLLRRYYLIASSNIQRIELICRSPIVTQVGTSLHGISTIHAFRSERHFMEEFHEKLDEHTSVYYMYLGTSRWLGACLDWIGFFYSSIVIIAFIIFEPNASKAGLAISSVIGISNMLSSLITISTELENRAISIERVLEYSDIPPEAPLQTPNNRRAPENWPSKGQITLHDVEVKYGPNSPTILSNFNMSIKSNEKIGVVGRTGAGKSTLVSVLFRIVEAYKGKVHIDGLDCFAFGLHDLRTKISFIPQNPVLFTGSLRKNLDPFNRYNDDVIWNALKEVHLFERIKNNSDFGLDIQVREGGSNFSHGEKQLISLARAMLNKNKILILDEATAHIDQETDGLIQATIREKFKNCTVLTIAHRLGTIIDSDRVCLIDAGKVIEFDDPYELMQNTNSKFYQLVQSSGKESAETIMKTVKRIRRNKLNEDKSICQTGLN